MPLFGSLPTNPITEPAVNVIAEKGAVIGVNNNKEIFDYIRENLNFDQLIWEAGTDENPDWVHVSLKKTGNRKEVLRMKNKKYTKY